MLPPAQGAFCSRSPRRAARFGSVRLQPSRHRVDIHYYAYRIRAAVLSITSSLAFFSHPRQKLGGGVRVFFFWMWFVGVERSRGSAHTHFQEACLHSAEVRFDDRGEDTNTVTTSLSCSTNSAWLYLQADLDSFSLNAPRHTVK